MTRLVWPELCTGSPREGKVSAKLCWRQTFIRRNSYPKRWYQRSSSGKSFVARTYGWLALFTVPSRCPEGRSTLTAGFGMWAPRTKQGSHINVLELLTIVHSFEWRARKAAYGDCRSLHLSDSQVSLAVATKGRSSSRALNRVLRRFCSLQLATGVHPLLCWIESFENPADEPSRRYEPEA